MSSTFILPCDFLESRETDNKSLFEEDGVSQGLGGTWTYAIVIVRFGVCLEVELVLGFIGVVEERGVASVVEGRGITEVADCSEVADCIG